MTSLWTNDNFMRISLRNSGYILEIHLRYVWYMPSIYLSFTQDLPEIQLRYTFDIPKIYLRNPIDKLSISSFWDRSWPRAIHLAMIQISILKMFYEPPNLQCIGLSLSRKVSSTKNWIINSQIIVDTIFSIGPKMFFLFKIWEPVPHKLSWIFFCPNLLIFEILDSMTWKSQF